MSKKIRRTKAGRLDGRSTRYLQRKHDEEDRIAELEAGYQVYLLASADKRVFLRVEHLRSAGMSWIEVLRLITAAPPTTRGF